MNVEPLPTRREDLAGLLRDVERLEDIFAGWEGAPRNVASAYGRAVEALYGEALRRLVRALKGEPAALAAMKRAVADEVVYAVLRRQGILRPSLDERVEAALAGVRPLLVSHGGDVELVSVTPPSIAVRFVGACDGCPASALTFREGVERAVKEACPEITAVKQIKGVAGPEGLPGPRLVSPFALTRDGTWRTAAELAEVPDGGVMAVEIGGEGFLLARRGAVVTCFENACAHLGLALDGGKVESGVISCPHHGFRYSLESGECISAPTVQLTPRAVRIVGTRVDVKVER